MKKFLYLIGLFAAVLGVVSCTEELQEIYVRDVAPSVSETAMTLSCKPLPSEMGETKSKFEYGDVEKKKMVRSVQVFAYDYESGALAASAYWDNGTPVERLTCVDPEEFLDNGSLAEDQKCVFFFLGNLPKIEAGDIPATLEGMRSWTYEFSDYSTFDSYGFPMAAVRGEEGAVVYDLVGNEVELLRLVSQWTVNFQDVQSGLTYENVKVSIRNAASSVQPFSDNPEPASVFDNIQVDGDNETVCIGDSGVFFYVLENMQGEAFPDATDYSERELVGGLNDKVTYLELKSSAYVNNAPLYIENTIYRYVLGDIDNKGFSNADVKRHTEYSLTLSFSDTSDENSPEIWQKDISEPYITDPHIGFDYTGVVVNHLGSGCTLPFDEVTKSYIANYGEQVEVDWSDGIGPYADTGEPLVSLSVNESGIVFLPSPTLEEYFEKIAESELPVLSQPYSYAFSLNNRTGVDLGDFVEELRDYQPESWGIQRYIALKFGMNPNLKIRLDCTNSLMPYSVVFPVHLGPLSITVHTGYRWDEIPSNNPWNADWKKIGEAGYWWYFINKGKISNPAVSDQYKYYCPFRLSDSAANELYSASDWKLTATSPKLTLCYTHPTTHEKTYTYFPLSIKENVPNYNSAYEELRMYSKDWVDYIPVILNEWNPASGTHYDVSVRLNFDNPSLRCTGGKLVEYVDDFRGGGMPLMTSDYLSGVKILPFKVQ